jgi:hypothetical protein
MGMLFGVAGDAANDLTTPARLRFDQNRDLTDTELIVIVVFSMVHDTVVYWERTTGQKFASTRRTKRLNLHHKHGDEKNCAKKRYIWPLFLDYNIARAHQGGKPSATTLRVSRCPN